MTKLMKNKVIDNSGSQYKHLLPVFGLLTGVNQRWESHHISTKHPENGKTRIIPYRISLPIPTTTAHSNSNHRVLLLDQLYCTGVLPVHREKSLMFIVFLAGVLREFKGSSRWEEIMKDPSEWNTFLTGVKYYIDWVQGTLETNRTNERVDVK